MRICVQVATPLTDGDPVLYGISYLVQYLLDLKAKFISPVDCRSLISDKMAITSKLILVAVRVLRIKLHDCTTQFRFSWINNSCTADGKSLFQKRSSLRSFLLGLLVPTGESYAK